MKFIDLLTKLLDLPDDAVRALLQNGIVNLPDFAGTFQGLLAKLDQEVDLGELAAAIPGEMRDVLSGHLNPKSHPSDDI